MDNVSKAVRNHQMGRETWARLAMSDRMLIKDAG
jgi:hypothetical protein